MMTTLYRLFDVDGVLLYVGIAKSPMNRFGQHANDKAWWVDVASSTMQHYATRAEAEEAERQAIAIERPVYNIALTSRPQFRDQCREQPTALDPNDAERLRAELSRLRVKVEEQRRQIATTRRVVSGDAAHTVAWAKDAMRWLLWMIDDRVERGVDEEETYRWLRDQVALGGSLVMARLCQVAHLSAAQEHVRYLVQECDKPKIRSERQFDMWELWAPIFGVDRQELARLKSQDWPALNEIVERRFGWDVDVLTAVGDAA